MRTLIPVGGLFGAVRDGRGATWPYGVGGRRRRV